MILVIWTLILGQWVIEDKFWPPIQVDNCPEVAAQINRNYRVWNGNGEVKHKAECY